MTYYLFRLISEALFPLRKPKKEIDTSLDKLSRVLGEKIGDDPISKIKGKEWGKK